jgi:nitric oxide dioxygenase
MTPEEISLVRATFAQVVPIRTQAAALFYERLFEIAPQVKPLFKGDMQAQGAMLMSAIALVVHGLDRLEAILPQVELLARRHVGYGVEESHYAVVGDALLWTLEKGLGAAFTPEVRAAWASAYGLLAGAMIEADRAERLAA